MYGKEFRDMEVRRAEAEVKKRQVLESQRLTEAENKKKQDENRRLTSKRNIEIGMGTRSSNQLSWEQIQDLEETNRNERREHRKRELISTSSLPHGMAMIAAANGGNLNIRASSTGSTRRYC